MGPNPTQLMSLGEEDRGGRVCRLPVKTQRAGGRRLQARRRASGETSPPHTFLLDCKGVSVRGGGPGLVRQPWEPMERAGRRGWE